MNAAWLVTVLLLGQTDEHIMGVTKDGRYVCIDAGDAPTHCEEVGGKPVEDADAFIKKHVLVPAVASRASPDGKWTIDVVAEPVEATGADTWSPRASLIVVARRGRERFVLTSTDSEFEVFWTPDSRGVLLREHTSMTVTGARGMSMNLDETFISSYRPLPSVRVVAHTLRLASNAIAKWRDDDVSLFAGQSKGARARSTVYFAPGKEPLARRFAQRLGENTPVEPLSWATAYDVVVALGDAP